MKASRGIIRWAATFGRRFPRRWKPWRGTCLQLPGPRRWCRLPCRGRRGSTPARCRPPGPDTAESRAGSPPRQPGSDTSALFPWRPDSARPCMPGRCAPPADDGGAERCLLGRQPSSGNIDPDSRRREASSRGELEDSRILRRRCVHGDDCNPESPCRPRSGLAIHGFDPRGRTAHSTRGS